ncbi:Uncharacterised protein [Serratia quinivorans]|uniref:MrpH family fimbial adhesin n=1 Tax=Serratia quinivorans TaxID=137545 RepID=UPI000D896A58|nr:hypothetical protein [Serratia quinivorans]SPZ65787.1 Uncharacterised protein [Serratia quinivorans]VEI74012.1 Uncharacterised protein [Serratia quinivorans]
MYPVIKRIWVVSALLTIPSQGDALEVSFNQTSPTTGTVVVSGDPVAGWRIQSSWGTQTAARTEAVCIKLCADLEVCDSPDYWCSRIEPAPWIAEHYFIGYEPSSPFPGVGAWWDAWRANVPGKSYHVNKGWQGNNPLPLCSGLATTANRTSFSWCGSNYAGSSVTHGWRVPINVGPPIPASCQTYQVPSIDFGIIDPKEINGKKATSQVVVSCDKKASVRVRFMTREGLAIFQMDNGLTTYLKIDDNPGTAGSYQTVAENASSPARAFNLSAELLGTSGSVKPGAFSYTAVVRVDIL